MGGRGCGKGEQSQQLPSSARLREPGVGREVSDAASISPSLRLAGMRRAWARGSHSPKPDGKIPSGAPQAGFSSPWEQQEGPGLRGASPAPGRVGQSGGTYVTYVTLCKKRLLPTLSDGNRRRQTLLPCPGISHFQWKLAPLERRVPPV